MLRTRSRYPATWFFGSWYAPAQAFVANTLQLFTCVLRVDDKILSPLSDIKHPRNSGLGGKVAMWRSTVPTRGSKCTNALTGKTTVLRSWLTNAENIRVGVVVNDVAEVRETKSAWKRGFRVNIDGELISNVSGIGAHTLVQLENGCACCSLGDDLLSSMEHLIKTGEESGQRYDHLIVEVSSKCSRLTDCLQGVMLTSPWSPFTLGTLEP
eukprot:5039458-Pyramimonas_sp.AAC.1